MNGDCDGPARTLSYNEYYPYLSPYLMGGYKKDELVLESVSVEKSAINARIGVKNYYLPTDGVFHLAVPLVFVAVAQLAIIWAHIDAGLDRKESEVFVHKINLACKRTVSDTTGIPIRLELSNKRTIAGGIYIRGEISVADGAFTGTGGFLVSSKPSIP